VWALGVLAVAGAMAAGGYLMGPGKPGPEALPPAPGPPVVGLCTQALTHANGSVSPLFCANGDINRLAWAYFANAQVRVLGLGIFASDTEVAAAVGQDVKGRATDSAECDAYRLAVAYYGWSFGLDPTSGVIKGGCPTSGT
jgi:hypothetical protein